MIVIQSRADLDVIFTEETRNILLFFVRER